MAAGAKTGGGATPLPKDLPLSGPLGKPLGMPLGEPLEKPLGSQDLEVANRRGICLGTSTGRATQRPATR